MRSRKFRCDHVTTPEPWQPRERTAKPAQPGPWAVIECSMKTTRGPCVGGYVGEETRRSYALEIAVGEC